MKYKKYLEQYEDRGHFSFKLNQDLNDECNAPKDKGGVYLIYKIQDSKEVLIYIGHSKIESKPRKGGLHAKIVKGHHSLGKPDGEFILTTPAAQEEMKNQGIEEIVIYWAVTDKPPNDVKQELLKKYKPDWHRQ